MKLTRRRKLFTFIALVLIISIPAYVVFVEYLSANAVTIAKAKQIQSGMTLAEVHSILGKPRVYGFAKSDGNRRESWYAVDGFILVSYDAGGCVQTFKTVVIDRWTMLKFRLRLE